ncbi:hypothetical protein CEXT_118401 [Caerostris extrusa]|uniref:Uncharacterized protein n=1 Tax=Caerostris extrusa TaxID=172846 RepID=A0AAV4UFX0_CAEEX|nr:hypothetical protein CEXT_118401 [Caerostris extrusa]
MHRPSFLGKRGSLSFFYPVHPRLMPTPNDAVDEIHDWGFGRGLTLLCNGRFYHSWRKRRLERGAFIRRSSMDKVFLRID